MARLNDPVLDDAEVTERIRARRGGELLELDRMLLHSPPVADGWNTMLGAIRERTSLAGDLRELVILRVAVLNSAAFEWDSHVPVARAEGVTEGQLAAIRGDDGDDLAALSPAERAAIAHTDAMTRDVRVPDDVFAALREHFDDRQIVELTATTAAYNLVSRFLVALEIGPQR